MRGFTIVELLISISVMAVIFSIGLASYRGSNSRYAEIRSAQTMAQAIREVQNMALSGYALNCTGPPPGKSCKYGVYASLVPNQLVIFGDGHNGNPKNENFETGEQLKSFTLEDGIQITQIFVGGASKDHVRIFFDPPNPLISFHPPPGQNAKIVITGGRSVSVTAGGSVDVD